MLWENRPQSLRVSKDQPLKVPNRILNQYTPKSTRRIVTLINFDALGLEILSCLIDLYYQFLVRFGNIVEK